MYTCAHIYVLTSMHTTFSYTLYSVSSVESWALNFSRHCVRILQEGSIEVKFAVLVAVFSYSLNWKEKAVNAGMSRILSQEYSGLVGCRACLILYPVYVGVLVSGQIFQVSPSIS